MMCRYFTSSFVLAAVLAGCITLTGCTGGREGTSGREDRSGGDAMSDGGGPGEAPGAHLFSPAGLSPGSARLRGTIVTVNRESLSADATSPCRKYPCMATVRVDSVYGYGVGFPSPMAPGEEFVATFEFTLGPTKELFPGMGEHYPGLEAGSTFDADVIYMQRPGRNPDPRRDGSLIIYGYHRLL